MLWAALAALLYAVSAPLSKLLLTELMPVFAAGLLYLGAGIGMAAMGAVRRLAGRPAAPRFIRADMPFVVGMVLLDILAPILLMTGLKLTTAANAALLNNFEIVATALIALVLFREPVSKRLWLGIAFITLSTLVLSFEDMSSLSFSTGSVLVVLACVCWGFENNCTRRLCQRDPLMLVTVKGLGSGLGALGIAFCLGEVGGRLPAIAAALALGFVAYGLSIYFYVHAQRELGAARTSAYCALSPFFGVLLSLVIFAEPPGWQFYAALAAMAAGAYLASTEKKLYWARLFNKRGKVV
jgi:drug/metabolite transporter (DMT)-like permease